MSKLQKNAYAKLAPDFCIPFARRVIDFSGIFPKKKGSLIMEIGFGMGIATAKIAGENPDKNYVCVEVHKPGVGKLLSEIEKKNLDNIRIIEADAYDVLTCMIQDSSLSGFHIFFPDPWPKIRHHKRRLIQDDFTRLLVLKLLPGGYIYVATDWEDYARWIKVVFDSNSDLVNPYGDFAPVSKWRPVTGFEQKGRNQNHSIFEIFVQKA
ncbi:MAG: tRNA (guanosine(46)-N7)-methyltransferase TrmB [Spirochaetota bacterium]